MRRRSPTTLISSTGVLREGREAPATCGPCAKKASRSSCVIRPAGPVPGTWRRSTPASRALRRIGRRCDRLVALGPRIARRPAEDDRLRAFSRARRRAWLHELDWAAGSAARRLGRRGRAGASAAFWLAHRCDGAFPSTLRRIRGEPMATTSPISGAEPEHFAIDRRRDLDSRLVGHDGGEYRVLAHEVADLRRATQRVPPRRCLRRHRAS